MAKMSVQQAAEKWNLSVRRVQNYCKEGRIEGAERFGNAWMIPVHASRPEDGRKKSTKVLTQKLVRKSPFLDMTDLYNEAGSAEKSIESLKDYPESQQLFKAEIAYSQGKIDEVIAHSESILASKSGFYAITAGGMLLALAAMWKGDVTLWKKARLHLYDVKCETDDQRDQLSLSLACIDTAIRDLSVYPEWFLRGSFEHLPPSAYPCAKVFYVKYLLVYAQELSIGEKKSDLLKGDDLLKSLPYLIEPLIAQTMIDRTIIPEIYLRVLGAIVYHQIGLEDRAIVHLDKAIALALPDNLLGILAEHRRQLDFLLDDRLYLADKDAFKRYKEMHTQLLSGWTKLHNSVLQRTVSMQLSIREREVARLASFGLQNQEIANRLNISLATTKKIIYDVMNKTGVNKRSELKRFI